MQDKTNTLQQQVVYANQMKAQANSAYQNLASSCSTVDAVKPDKCYGKNARSWSQSVENYFAAQQIELSEHSKVRLVASYMSSERLQRSELPSLQQIFINSFSEYKEKMLNHVEPVNREQNARKIYSI